MNGYLPEEKQIVYSNKADFFASSLRAFSCSYKFSGDTSGNKVGSA